MTLNCRLCNEPVDPRASGNFRLVQGWAKTRSGGGTNGITERKELAEYIHSHCMKLRRLGVDQGQQELFE